MNAIARRLAAPFACSLALAACVPPPEPRPGPAPTPQAAAPIPRPTTSAMPTPPSADWRDAPLTPGGWTLGQTSGGLVADFANLFTMRCTHAEAGIVLTLHGAAGSASGSLRFTTDTREQLLVARRTPEGLSATVPAREPLLDAIAFSRGRFRLQSSDGRTLVMPSWTEISRVIEDCR